MHRKRPSQEYGYSVEGTIGGSSEFPEYASASMSLDKGMVHVSSSSSLTLYDEVFRG